MAKVTKDLFSAAWKSTCNIRRHYGVAEIAPLQKAALEERCILVDELDRQIGEATKRDCHRISDNGNILLHRAFSVFLFNGSGDLLIQRRSPEKVTFPGYYTNTCCSHPLAEIPGEMIEENEMGIRRAAQRRLGYELGIPLQEIKPSDFVYLSRIHYFSLGDGTWGEHEIDYVLFLQKNKVTLDPNPDEVSEIHWVPKSRMGEFVQQINAPLTPWFHLILQHRLPLWWNNLHALNSVKDYSVQKFL